MISSKENELNEFPKKKTFFTLSTKINLVKQFLEWNDLP